MKLDWLRWQMGRFTGYVALVNDSGGKPMADQRNMAPVLKEAAARGLGYLDDNPLSRGAPDVAPATPFARADVVIDANATPEAIDAALARLVALARRRGSAIGDVSATAGSIEHLARWTNGLDFEGRRAGPALSPVGGDLGPVDSIEPVRRSMSGRQYRPCVGIALVNRDGHAFIGHRKRKRGSEVLDPHSWQMPQGGIDGGEQPFEAAKRELWEETNVRSTELIAELPEWLQYDLPEDARGRWSGRYRGNSEVVSVPVCRPRLRDRRSPSGRRGSRCRI